jgi:predicted enzyme related to lactoylglutathione lyase
MPSADNKPGSFCWFELGTTDQQAAKQFYMPLLGWTVEEFPIGPSRSYSMFRLNGQDVAAGYALNEEQLRSNVPPHWMIYVAVSDVDALAKKVTELGGKVWAGPFDASDFGRMAVVSDPAGAMFSLWQAKQHPGVGAKGAIGSFCWADLMTRDARPAQEFYSGLFGWTFDPGDSGYLHIKNGTEYIGGIPPKEMQNQQAPPHWLLYFMVDNCENSTSKAQSLGARVLAPPMPIPNVGSFSVLQDPQGAVFALFQSPQQ